MKILILGGGISGVSSAWFLRKKYPEAHITLLEKTPTLGGYVATEKKGAFLFERGPRTFQMARSPALYALIHEVGLGHDLVFSDPAARTRYLWVEGRLRPLSQLWPAMLAALAKDLVMPKKVCEEESIYAFASRRFGKKAAELFFDPLTQGIFGGDIRKLSLHACFPSLHKLEATHRSIAWGLFASRRHLKTRKLPSETTQNIDWGQKGQSAPRDLRENQEPTANHGLFTLRGGMHQLIQALSNIPIDIHTDCSVQRVHTDHVIAGERKWEADWIVSALPAQEIAKTTGISLSLRNEALSVVNLGYEGRWPLRGYGYLVPTSEKEELLGQIWDSVVFGNRDNTILTSMVRSQDPERAALDAMKRHFGETREPSQMRLQQAFIPQYDVGHEKRIAAFEAELQCRFPTLKLVGNYLTGPSVEACIQRAFFVQSQIRI